MSEFRELLEREGERFELPPRGLERMRRRHLRRQRTRRVATSMLALALALVGTLLAVRAFRGVPPPPRPADEPLIVDTWSVGTRPLALAASEGAVWVVTASDRALLRLDPSTGEVVDRIPITEDVGPPIDVTVSGGSVWVKTRFVDPRLPDEAPAVNVPAVVRVDVATNRVRSTIILEHDTLPDVAVRRGGLWNANSATGVVSRRDLRGGRVTLRSQGPVPAAALVFGEGAVWSLGRGRADVVPPIPGTIARIDPRTASVTSSTEVGLNPRDLAVGEGAVWAVSAADRTVSRIDAATVSVTDVIRVPGGPTQIAAGPSGVWALDASGDTLFRIDPAKKRLADSISVGPDPVALASVRGGVLVAQADGTILHIEP